MRSWVLLLFAVYFVVIVSVLGGLAYARSRVLDELGRPEAIAEWRQWKEATRQTGDAPVTRRVPTTDEPPALVLFRDHFAAIIVTSVAIATFMVAFLAFIVRGMAISRAASTDQRGASL
jgi:hypothetical protein